CARRGIAAGWSLDVW
nr:immunoglobulin heavy chain junction region [Macaca mulatta]MOV53573.1 immunoglobulin heavy chain junction region [Macaca mulatta]MOV53582.1 immunoglobulin heavy chain junction region [Macaca mulatta]MOV54157.1 immunoglobulin heavy chain junction region [Macaca mulatta]MOV54647.1 immunoglobulin heavy chain junction region [Macaca mulatta]